MDAVLALAGQIAEASPRAVQNIRKLAIESLSISFHEAVQNSGWKCAARRRAPRPPRARRPSSRRRRRFIEEASRVGKRK